MILHNFATSRSILAALDSSTISRLQQTWMVRFDFVLAHCHFMYDFFDSVGCAAEAKVAA
jgi:hypothetical protein